jgi:hypothetical protein
MKRLMIAAAIVCAVGTWSGEAWAEWSCSPQPRWGNQDAEVSLCTGSGFDRGQIALHIHNLTSSRLRVQMGVCRVELGNVRRNCLRFETNIGPSGNWRQEVWCSTGTTDLSSAQVFCPAIQTSVLGGGSVPRQQGVPYQPERDRRTAAPTPGIEPSGCYSRFNQGGMVDVRTTICLTSGSSGTWRQEHLPRWTGLQPFTCTGSMSWRMVGRQIEMNRNPGSCIGASGIPRPDTDSSLQQNCPLSSDARSIDCFGDGNPFTWAN